MKTIRLNTRTTKIFVGVVAALFLFTIDLQAKKVSFLKSSVVPAARGYVKITRDDNRNYNIKINLSDLAEVFRLQPSKLTYVVWMVSSENNTLNMGQIKSSATFLTKKLKATFETTTSLKPTRIFVTAEDDPSFQVPGEQLILTTKRF